MKRHAAGISRLRARSSPGSNAAARWQCDWRCGIPSDSPVRSRSAAHFPRHVRALARLHRIRRLPLFLAITSQSECYPQQQVCQHLRLFHSANLKVTIHQYPGDDALTTVMLSDMDRWVMEQVTGARGMQSPIHPNRSLN